MSSFGRLVQHLFSAPLLGQELHLFVWQGHLATFGFLLSLWWLHLFWHQHASTSFPIWISASLLVKHHHLVLVCSISLVLNSITMRAKAISHAYFPSAFQDHFRCWSSTSALISRLRFSREPCWASSFCPENNPIEPLFSNFR